MTKIDEKIKKAADKFAEQEAEIGEIDRDALYKGFFHGAKWALSHQWVSVDDALPKPKDYEYRLLPSIGDDRPSIYVFNPFQLYIKYNDGSGFDLCEANFKVLPDGSFVWLYSDDCIASQISKFKVTHWMPIPPLPEARKEGEV